jgi:thiol:disulfide interchange protein DsbC
MNTRIARLFLLPLLGALSLTIAAVGVGTKAKMVEALSAFVGQPIGIDRVRPSPAPGIVEAQVTNGPMIYATADGNHFFLQGDLHAYRSGEVVNLTEEGRVVERLALINAIETDDMIIFSPEGETRDYINVFTDVSCGYCQKLHREVADLNDYGIEVRYLAYPRAGVGSEGARELETAWCSDNPQEALTKLKSGTNLPKISCNSELIAAQYELGNKLGVRGTPAILTSDGRLIPGYQPASNLAKMLGLE